MFQLIPLGTQHGLLVLNNMLKVCEKESVDVHFLKEDREKDAMAELQKNDTRKIQEAEQRTADMLRMFTFINSCRPLCWCFPYHYSRKRPSDQAHIAYLKKRLDEKRGAGNAP